MIEKYDLLQVILSGSFWSFPLCFLFFFFLFVCFLTSSGFDPNQREERGNPMGEESHLLNSCYGI